MDKILSIIVPSYNMEAYLPKCLGSLIIDDKELLQKLDVIVVNDGSKDRTSEIAHEFEAKYPGVFRVIDKPNGHYGSCINAALPVAKGLYVKVLDADDWFDTAGLCEFLKILQEDVSSDLIITDYETVDGDGVVLEHHTYALPQTETFDVPIFAQYDAYISMHSITYRLSILRELDYQQTEGVSYSDTEWTTIPIAKVSKIRYERAVVYKRWKGREGQSVSPEILARDHWMISLVFLHAAERFELIKTFSSLCAKEYVLKTIVNHLYETYMMCIVRGADLPSRFNIREFDVKLKVASRRIYDKVGDVVLSRKIPLRVVALWRRDSLVLALFLRAYKLYRLLVKKVK